MIVLDKDKEKLTSYNSNLSTSFYKDGGDGQSNKIRQAIERGYTGDICTECQSLTMVRNGTCLKCMTCGSTSGCS
jgi:ribonucleoside-diphosphate reductase alpha chain